MYAVSNKQTKPMRNVLGPNDISFFQNKDGFIDYMKNKLNFLRYGN